ncbi:MAG: class I SAM-dependent methyltransferase [Lachnospiraceae bacterium]|nr:class I SAM-dependent methyltransferase [Lachnospiraceae bacterium]
MSFTITDWIHEIAASYIKEGDLCIDGTAGKGNDTAFLCEKAGAAGHVLAFDIQKEAIDATRQYLSKLGFENRATLIQRGHEHMDEYGKENTVSVILFNLGYLPGGDHSLKTQAKTTIEAMEKGLSLLKNEGLMGICIYSGKDSGYEEKEAVLSWVKELPAGKFDVITTPFFNKPNDPPLPVFIRKR